MREKKQLCCECSKLTPADTEGGSAGTSSNPWYVLKLKALLYLINHKDLLKSVCA